MVQITDIVFKFVRLDKNVSLIKLEIASDLLALRSYNSQKWSQYIFSCKASVKNKEFNYTDFSVFLGIISSLSFHVSAFQLNRH